MTKKYYNQTNRLLISITCCDTKLAYRNDILSQLKYRDNQQMLTDMHQ